MNKPTNTHSNDTAKRHIIFTDSLKLSLQGSKLVSEEPDTHVAYFNIRGLGIWRAKWSNDEYPVRRILTRIVANEKNLKKLEDKLIECGVRYKTDIYGGHHHACEAKVFA